MVALLKRAGCLTVLSGAVLLSGCVAPEQAVLLEAPIVEREPIPLQEPTLLEKYQEVSRQCEAERLRANTLERRLMEALTARQRAETALKDEQAKTATLEAKACQLDDLIVKHQEAQKELLNLGATLRDVRRELLQERLARIKQEQLVVSLKLKDARDRRQQLLSGADPVLETAAAQGPTGEAEKREDRHD